MGKTNFNCNGKNKQVKTNFIVYIIKNVFVTSQRKINLSAWLSKLKHGFVLATLIYIVVVNTK